MDGMEMTQDKSLVYLTLSLTLREAKVLPAGVFVTKYPSVIVFSNQKCGPHVVSILAIFQTIQKERRTAVRRGRPLDNKIRSRVPVQSPPALSSPRRS